jgi:hypothetical protein
MFKKALEQNKNDSITHTFLLTINSNKAATSEEEATQYKNYLMKSLEKMFNVFEDFVDIYLAGNHLHKKKAYVDFNDIAEDVRVNPQFEIGPTQKRIHTHIVIKWDSSPTYFFQINLIKLRNWIESNVGSFYVNVRWIKGDSELFRYINKSK